MSYPSMEQYQEALQNINSALTDKELACGTIATSGLGLPLAMCGGFALTYTIKTQNSKYAVRCFHRQSNALEERYKAISKSILSFKSSYFVKFEFQPNGVKVYGNTFPVVKMEWARGTTLSEFIEANYKNKTALESLTKALQHLATFLESNNIAHGDIQPGNLMVSGSGSNLQLIDYDGMFVQEISRLGSSELGHRNFQHPKRDSTVFDKNLDRFSFISLALSLKALQEDSSLWNYSNSEADAIIFRANDFNDPASSTIFKKLHSYPSLSTDARNFASICTSGYNSTPNLLDFMSHTNIPLAVVTIHTGSNQYISQYLVLDATDYKAFISNIGQMVELVGQILEVTNKTARNGRPYIFINFANWRGDCVKLTIWSETLEKMSVKPDARWNGRWVSVSGLVDPTYHSKRFKYTHVGISITAPNQIHTISAKEAAYRLGSSQKPNNIVQAGGHKDGVSGKSAPNISRNQAIVDNLKGRTQPAVSHTQPTLGRTQPTTGCTQKTQAQRLDELLAQPRRPSQSSPYGQPSLAKNSGCLVWCIVILILLALFCIY